MGHFDGIFWLDILMRQFNGTFLWDILMRHFDGTFGRDILMRHFDETFWCAICTRHFDETFHLLSIKKKKIKPLKSVALTLEILRFRGIYLQSGKQKASFS